MAHAEERNTLEDNARKSVEATRGMAINVEEVMRCFHQFQRGILLDKWNFLDGYWQQVCW